MNPTAIESETATAVSNAPIETPAKVHSFWALIATQCLRAYCYDIPRNLWDSAPDLPEHKQW
jgi:hypothetical protein